MNILSILQCEPLGKPTELLSALFQVINRLDTFKQRYIVRGLETGRYHLLEIKAIVFLVGACVFTQLIQSCCSSFGIFLLYGDSESLLRTFDDKIAVPVLGGQLDITHQSVDHADITVSLRTAYLSSLTTATTGQIVHELSILNQGVVHLLGDTKHHAVFHLQLTWCQHE